MTCNDFTEWIEDLAAAEVEPARAADLRAHAASCPPCGARLAGVEAMNRRLRDLRDHYTPPAHLAERVREALRAATGRPSRPDPGWTRLWRWAPAAAAALLMVAVVALFVAGPGAVPPLIADTVAAYEGLSSGARELEVDARDPKAVQDYFRQRLHLWLPAPATVGAGAYTLKGGCACREAATGSQIPCAVYDRGSSLLALMACDRTRLDPAVIDRAARMSYRGHEVCWFAVRGVTVLLCPSSSVVHIWIGRMSPAELCEAAHATPEGRLALDGIRISIEDMTCEMCCAGVREALEGVPGVKAVGFDMARGEAQVLADSSDLRVDALVEALRKAGYKAKAAGE